MALSTGFALYLLDATFRIAQRMHVVPATAASNASDDKTLATLTFRWSNVRAQPLPLNDYLPKNFACTSHLSQPPLLPLEGHSHCIEMQQCE